jgi:hypothetical protein
MNTYEIIALKFGLNSKGFIKKFVANTRCQGEAPPNEIFFRLYSIIIFLMICDVLTTMYALSLPGNYEGNSIMSIIVSSPFLFLGVKLLFLLWIPLFYRLSRGYENISILGLEAIVLMYSGVVINNVLVILL